MDGATPSSLVERMREDVLGGESGEESIVGVAVVAKAVDED